MLAVAVSSVSVISSSVHLSMNTCAIWTSVCSSANVKRVFWNAATGPLRMNGCNLLVDETPKAVAEALMVAVEKCSFDHGVTLWA